MIRAEAEISSYRMKQLEKLVEEIENENFWDWG